jgi:hypothetical protein
VKRKKGKNRTKVSFVITILVLSTAAILGYVFSFRTPSYSIPSSLTPYTGLVGKYAPADALQVTYANYSAIRALNTSAVPDKQLLNLVKPAVTVHMDSVSARVMVTILNTAAHINNTGTAAVLDPGAYATLTRVLDDANWAAGTRVDNQGWSYYEVNDSSNGRTKTEWLAPVPDASSVMFAEGDGDAQKVLQTMQSVWEGSIPSILTNRNVTRMLYAVGGTNHLALSIQNFTGEVLTSKAGLVTVDQSGSQVQLTHLVQFASADYASSQVGEVKGVYRFASDFSLWEENVKAVQDFTPTNLEGAVALAGGL